MLREKITFILEIMRGLVMKTHVCSYSMNIYMRKKLPIGIDGFAKIRTNDFYYADKTMFIKELLQN